MVMLHRSIPPSGRWGWVPSAASALLLAAVAVALMVVRKRFLAVADRLQVDPTGRRIFSLGALLLAVVAAWRGWRHARRAARSFPGRRT